MYVTCSLKNILKTQKWKIQKVEVPQKSSLWVIIVTELMYIHPEGFPGGTIGKELVCQCRRHKRCKFNPWVGKIPWRRAWQATSVFLSEESHGQRSLAVYIP